MSPKAKQTDNKKNVIIASSRVAIVSDDLERHEETEIAAQISVPREGGWGWVVVVASFWNIFIIDGIIFTYGTLLPEIASEFNIVDSLAALINSTQGALYFFAGPLVSSLINKFGFRSCIMAGSIVCSLAVFSGYFSSHYAALLLMYGIVFGFGSSLINMSATLVVGFYFEKLRSLVLAIITCGSSFGITAMFPINATLVTLGGWRTTILFHSGLLALIYFFGLTYRPLLSLTVVKTDEQPIRRVTLLPNLGSSPAAGQATISPAAQPTRTERLLCSVKNCYFPTAAAVVGAGISTTSVAAGTSAEPVAKLTLIAHKSKGGISPQHLKQVRSIMSKTIKHGPRKSMVEVTIEAEKPRKRSCWARLCHWEVHISQARPMYRDDAFYEGNIEDLEIYHKSVNETAPEARIGLEYQLAVTRAVPIKDLQEKHGIFTASVRRVLVTMLDTTLLKRYSFLFFCISGMMIYVGLLVPYVYLKDRNLRAKVDPIHCDFFVSAIGLSNAVGKLFFGVLSSKIDPIKLYAFSVALGGIGTVVSDISYDLYYQYCYCVAYGFFLASASSLRSVVLVSLYGLEKLTNATGILLLFLGLGNLVGTPLAAVLKDSFGYTIAFYVAGTFMALGGIIAIPIKVMSKRENKKILNNNYITIRLQASPESGSSINVAERVPVRQRSNP